ncbi:MAG: hypothetical protein LBJ79_00755 [Endomicrobium sp.]|nr:hypothetical protein [Endomicrobium sp.]
MFKKLILTAVLCCTLSAVSNAIWLPAFFMRFVSSYGPQCTAACQACEVSGNPRSRECQNARGTCASYECPAAYEEL